MIKKLLKDIKALAQGLQIAGKHLGKHAVTIQYPEERWTMPERSRGMVVLLSDKETGELNCTACILCEKACPTGAIRIEAPQDEKKKRHLKAFVVDYGLCCFCGLCEEACNFSAIKLATKYEFSTLSKEDLVWNVQKLQEMGRDVDYVDVRKKKPVPGAAKAPAAGKAVAGVQSGEASDTVSEPLKSPVTANESSPAGPDAETASEEGQS
ncbi:MAG TPA: NADH-quinone oxidoreductase subunit I [Candidatus Deferrimicrobium sp.]|nr:NADH-quinone oxidoreductase subunit I [Candidatus Deferrimicrobium sp.]